METQAPPPNRSASPIRKALRVGCGCLVVFLAMAIIGLMLLIGKRDNERQRRCDEALGARVTRRESLADADATGGRPLTIDILRTDDPWTHWPDYARDIGAHLNGGGQARLVWTDNDTMGVLLFDRDGRAVRHVCFVT